MGALHRLVDLLNKLDPNNRRWKEQQLARARADRELAERMQDEVNRENARRDIEDPHCRHRAFVQYPIPRA